MSTKTIFVRSNSVEGHFSDVDFFWGAEVPAGNFRYGKHIFAVTFNTDCEAMEFTAGTPNSNYTYGFKTVGNDKLEEPILGSNVWYCVNVNRIISISKLSEQETLKYNKALAAARKAQKESNSIQSTTQEVKTMSLSDQIRNNVSASRRTVSEVLAVAAEVVTVLDNHFEVSSLDSSEVIEVEAVEETVKSDKSLADQIRDNVAASSQTVSGIFAAAAHTVEVASNILEVAPVRQIESSSVSISNNNIEVKSMSASNVSTPSSISAQQQQTKTEMKTQAYSVDTKVQFRTDAEWAAFHSTFASAYNSNRVADGLVVACNHRGPRTKEALNSKSPFAHIAIIAKALAWQAAGGLDIPVQDGEQFIVPQIEYFEGKSVCFQSVIPGLAFIRAKGEDKTAAVIKWLTDNKKLKAVVKDAYNLAKKDKSVLPYAEKVASCLAIAIKNALPEKAASKVLVLAHWNLSNVDGRYVVVNGTWNYPRYNATAASVRSIVEACSAEYSRMGIPTGLHFVRGEETKDGYKVYLLDEVFTVTDSAVYYEGYCRQYLQRVLMYLPIDASLTVEDTALMTNFDILTNIIVEFVLIHTNREVGYGERSNGWNGFMSATDITTTFGNARNGLRKLMQKHVPVLDLEGTVDLDPQKAHHLKSSVTPCPRYVMGTEYTAFVGERTDKPVEFVGRGGKALVNARHKDVSGGTKAANANENKLLDACMLNDTGKGTMQPIIEVCNDLRLKVVITGNARKIADISNFACVVADLAPSLQRDFIVTVTGRLLKTTDRAAVIAYLNDKSAFAGTVSGLEVESDAWWAALIADAIIPYSTKGAKIDKRVLPALVASNNVQSDSAMQWFGAETFVDSTAETVIAPCFNLAAPGIGYGNYANREAFGAFYNTSSQPAEMVGVFASVEMLVEKVDFTLEAASSVEGYNFFNCSGVQVRKGQALAKVTLVDGTEIVIDSEIEGNLTQFAYRQIEKEIFGVRYFETAASYKNFTNTVKLRNGIKTNVVWSNNNIFSLNQAQYEWDLLIPADAYKAADILWYQMPEIASSFSLFDCDVVIAGVNPRTLLQEANVAAATLLGFDVEAYAVNNKLFYSPVADLYGCYDSLRNAFEVIYGQVKYLSYRNAADLYNFCVKFYSPAVEAKVWRNLTEAELAIISAETGLNVEFKMAIADTETLTAKTNVILLYGDNCVAYRGWVYGSNIVDGIYCPMMHPIKVEYTTIPQSVSKSKVMFGTAIDLGSESFDFGAYVYNGGTAFHNRYVMLENIVAGKNFSSNVEVKELDVMRGIEQILTVGQIAQLKTLLTTANRSVVLSEFAALVKETAFKINRVGFLIYFPLLASFGFEAANKSSVMTVAGRTYELIAHLLEDKNFGDKEVVSLLRSLENILTKMVGVVEDEDGNVTEKRNNHRESVSYGAQTVSCKIASCADIEMDKVYVLKNSKVYRRMVSVYGKETMAAGSVYVSYYRPPMTKAVACELVVVTGKENDLRDFPLSGDRIYGSFFAMNFNEGDQDGDGISFFYTPAADVEAKNVELATLDGMFLFIEKAIEYNQCSLEFWLKLKPYYAEQFYADHFNVKTFAEKAGKRGAQLKKSLISWTTWNENVRGAVAQQSVFVGCSYKAQAHHTMLITLLQDMVNCDWVDAATKDLIAASYGYALNLSAKYPVQNSYELALGGFDPNMAQVGALFLLPAWGAQTELSWFWSNTSLANIYAANVTDYSLGHLLGNAFLNKRLSNILDVDSMGAAFNELGYQTKWIKPLLNQFMIAGFTDAANKELNKAAKEEGTKLVEAETLALLCKLYPAYAVAIAIAQAVLSTSRSEGNAILDFVVKNVPAEILTGFAALIPTNIVMHMQNKIKTLRVAAKNGSDLDAAAISDVVRTFINTLVNETEVEETVIEKVVTTEEEVITIDFEDDDSFTAFNQAQLDIITRVVNSGVEVISEEVEEEFTSFSAAQIKIIEDSFTTSIPVVVEAKIEEVEEEFTCFSKAQIALIEKVAAPTEVEEEVTESVEEEVKEDNNTKSPNTFMSTIAFTHKESTITLQVVDTKYDIIETLSSGVLGSVVKIDGGLMFICKDEEMVRATIAVNKAAFDRLATCTFFTPQDAEPETQPEAEVVETVEEVEVISAPASVVSSVEVILQEYYKELNAAFTAVTSGEVGSIDLARDLLNKIESTTKAGIVHPILQAPVFPKKKPVVIQRVELEDVRREQDLAAAAASSVKIVTPKQEEVAVVKPETVEAVKVVEEKAVESDKEVFYFGINSRTTDGMLLSNEFSIRFKSSDGKSFNSLEGALGFYLLKPGQPFPVFHTLANCTGKQARNHFTKFATTRLRSDWKEVRESILLDLMRRKANLVSIRKVLESTKDYILVDSNDPTNEVGKLWMQIREEVLAPAAV